MSQLSLFEEIFTAEPEIKVLRKPSAKKEPRIDKKEEIAVKINSKKKPTILDGWQPQKQYYSIGEVAELFQVNTSHIRFWTKEFKIKLRTTRKGDRLFKPENIYDLQTIYHLVKERGFTLAGAKLKLKERKAQHEYLNLKESLLTLRKQLLIIRQQLETERS